MTKPHDTPDMIESEAPMLEQGAPVADSVPTRRMPADFLNPAVTPLATWTFRELQDALGTDKVAEVLGTTSGNVRMLRHRKAATIKRMQALQAAIREDEQAYRETLCTMYATGAFRRRA